MTEATIVLEDRSLDRRERSVTVIGSSGDVAELIGLYSLARQCVRDRIKVKEFRRLVMAAGDELLGE